MKIGCIAYNVFDVDVYYFVDCDKGCIINPKIDEFVAKLVVLDKKSGGWISTTDFSCLFRSYHEKDEDDWTQILESRNRIRRMLGNVDEESESRNLVELMKVFDAFVGEAKECERELPVPLYEEYRPGRHFADRDYENAVYTALAVYDRYKQRLLQDGIPSHSQTVIPEDEDGLVRVSSLERRGEWLLGDEGYAVLPAWSSKDVRGHIFRLIDSRKYKDVCISVRPQEVRSLNAITPVKYCMEALLYGRKFTHELFSNVEDCIPIVYSYSDKSLYKNIIDLIPLKRLECQIKKLKGGEVSLMIEEVIDFEHLTNNEITRFVCVMGGRACVRNRLIHAIYDMSKDCFIHLDLDYLYYNDREIRQRVDDNSHIGDIKVIEEKVFRLDGSVDFTTACNIIATALDASKNPEVDNLLHGKDMSDEERTAFFGMSS